MLFARELHYAGINESDPRNLDALTSQADVLVDLRKFEEAVEDRRGLGIQQYEAPPIVTCLHPGGGGGTADVGDLPSKLNLLPQSRGRRSAQ